MPGSIKIDDGSGNYTILTNAGSLGSDKTLTIPNTTGTMALTSDITSGLSSAQQWRLTASISTTGDNDITTNLEVPDTENQGNMGSLVSESSGIFSFSATGYYAVIVNQRGSGGSGGYVYIGTKLTDDNSTYTEAARAQWEGSGLGLAASSIVIIDVTNTSNDKVKFNSAIQTSGANITGSTTINFTTFTFLKLGET